MTEILYSANGIKCEIDETKTILTVSKDTSTATDGQTAFYCPYVTEGVLNYDISQVRKIIIADGITDISSNTFTSCSRLEEIELPKKITLKANAFKFANNKVFSKVVYNGALTDWCTEIKLDIADPSTDIYTSPLVAAQHLYLAGHEEEVTEIDLSTATITELKSFIFAGLKNVNTVKLPASLTTISNQAFWGCSSITSIEIPKATTYIGDLAFYSCSSLADVYICLHKYKTNEDNQLIPENYICLGKCVFADCQDLFTIHFEGKEADLNKIITNWNADWNKNYDYVNGQIAAAKNIQFKYGAVKYSGCTDYSSDCSGGLLWQQSYDNEITIVSYNKDILYKEPEIIDKQKIMYNWVEYIVDYDSFDRGITDNFLQIKIPAEINGCPVTTIATYAFSECHKVSFISLPATLDTIEDFAFYRCGSIKNFTVDENSEVFATVEVGSYLAGTVESYKYSYLINESNQTIVRYCTGCPNKRLDLVFNASINSIAAGAFESSLDLTECYIKLTDSLQITFGYDAFVDCEKLSEVVVDKLLGAGDLDITWRTWANINFINAQANPLYYAKKLYITSTGGTKTAIWGTSTAETPTKLHGEVKPFTFYNCRNLKRVDISCDEKSKPEDPDPNVLIGEYAFANCTALSKLSLPSATLECGLSAFENCRKLDTINFLGTLDKWCNSTFANEFANPNYYDINHTYTAEGNYILDYKKQLIGGISSSYWLSGLPADGTKQKIVGSTAATSSNTIIPDCTFMFGHFDESAINSSSSSTNGILRFIDDNTEGTNDVLEICPKYVGKYAFDGAVLPKYTIGEDYRVPPLKITSEHHIGYAAFRGTAIPDIIITGEDIKLDSYAFAGSSLSQENLINGTLLIDSSASNLVLKDNCFYKRRFTTITTPAKFLDMLDLTYCKNLTIIEDGTTLINSCFNKIANLESITFEFPKDITTINSVRNITSDSFRFCPNLAEIAITDKNDDDNKVCYYASNNCLILKQDSPKPNLLIFGANSATPGSITGQDIAIADYAFAYRTFESTNFYLPERTVAIGQDIFWGSNKAQD